MATNQEALDQIKQYLNESYSSSTTYSVPKKNDLTFDNTVKKLEHTKIFYIDMRKSRKILTEKYASKDSSFIIRQQQKQMHKKIMRKLKNLGLY